MLCVAKYLQVFWRVVKTIPIDVMDNVFGGKRPPEPLCCNNSMLVLPKVWFGNLDSPVQKTATSMHGFMAEWSAYSDVVKHSPLSGNDIWINSLVLAIRAPLGVVKRLSVCASFLERRLAAVHAVLADKLFRHTLTYTSKDWRASAFCKF